LPDKGCAVVTADDAEVCRAPFLPTQTVVKASALSKRRLVITAVPVDALGLVGGCFRSTQVSQPRVRGR
jgi:hypothetical protein